MVFRRVCLPLFTTLMVGSALTAPATARTVTPLPDRTVASASRPVNGFPSCGDHFTLSRSGVSVRVVGIGLNAFWPGYMLVYVSDSYNKSYGPYNASPRGGANFTINTGTSSKQSFIVELTDSNNYYTLCQSFYYA